MINGIGGTAVDLLYLAAKGRGDWENYRNYNGHMVNWIEMHSVIV